MVDATHHVEGWLELQDYAEKVRQVLHAEHPETWDLINELRCTCYAAPVQLEGTLRTGHSFYFRSRHRSTSLGLGFNAEGAVAATVHDSAPSSFARHEWTPPDGDRHPASWLEPPGAARLFAQLLTKIVTAQHEASDHG